MVDIDKNNQLLAKSRRTTIEVLTVQHGLARPRGVARRPRTAEETPDPEKVAFYQHVLHSAVVLGVAATSARGRKLERKYHAFVRPASRSPRRLPALRHGPGRAVRQQRERAHDPDAETTDLIVLT
jgi:hypothetical protein